MASDVVTITGTTAAIFTVSRGVPQAIRATRVSSTGVSVMTWTLSVVNSEFWTAYGVTAHLDPQIAANIPTAISSLIVVAFVVTKRHGRRFGLASAALCGLGALLPTTIAVLRYGGILTGASILLSLSLFTPQLIEVLIAKNLAGVSKLSWAMAVASSIFWGAYGLEIHNYPVIATNMVLGPSAWIIFLRVRRYERRAIESSQS